MKEVMLSPIVIFLSVSQIEDTVLHNAMVKAKGKRQKYEYKDPYSERKSLPLFEDQQKSCLLLLLIRTFSLTWIRIHQKGDAHLKTKRLPQFTT